MVVIGDHPLLGIHLHALLVLRHVLGAQHVFTIIFSALISMLNWPGVSAQIDCTEKQQNDAEENGRGCLEFLSQQALVMAQLVSKELSTMFSVWSFSCWVRSVCRCVEAVTRHGSSVDVPPFCSAVVHILDSGCPVDEADVSSCLFSLSRIRAADERRAALQKSARLISCMANHGITTRDAVWLNLFDPVYGLLPGVVQCCGEVETTVHCVAEALLKASFPAPASWADDLPRLLAGGSRR